MPPQRRNKIATGRADTDDDESGAEMGGLAITPPSDDESESGDITSPPLGAVIEVNIPTAQSGKVDVFYCTVRQCEDYGAVILLTQDGEAWTSFLRIMI